MKRKVVQHGPSTLIVSLPAKWIKRHHIRRGDELDVVDEGDVVRIGPGNIEHIERVTIDITELKTMIPRVIHSLYKRGTEELTLTYNDREVFAHIETALGKDAIGFELLESGEHRCVIKNVITGSKEFHQVLRQIFMLLLNMIDEGLQAFREGNAHRLTNLIALEKVNNRLTIFCRRHINTRGGEEYDKIGPLYYIVEQLERIADQYKYLYSYFQQLGSIKVSKDLLEQFAELNKNLRSFYHLFYTFNPEGVAVIKARRDKIHQDLTNYAPKVKTAQEVMLFHHLMTLNKDIFSLLDPYLVLAFKAFVKD